MLRAKAQAGGASGPHTSAAAGSDTLAGADGDGGAAGGGLDAAMAELGGDVDAMGITGLGEDGDVTDGTGPGRGEGGVGKRQAPPVKVRTVHISSDGNFDPLELVKAVNDGAADLAKLQQLVGMLHNRQQQLAVS